MTRRAGKAPPAAETFVQQDQTLQNDSGGQVIDPILPCGNQWKLRVKVEGYMNKRKASLGRVLVEVEWNDGTKDAPVCKLSDKYLAKTSVLRDRGPRSGICRARAPGWTLKSEVPVRMIDGDDTTVELKLAPTPWIAFEVIDKNTTSPIGGITVKARLPVLGEQTEVTVADEVLEWEHDDLPARSQCTLLDLEHDSLVYEVVGALTSS